MGLGSGKGSEGLRAAVEAVSLFDHTSPRTYLEALYVEAKARHDSYSYLKFAGHLGFSETNVIRLVIAGERPLTSKAAKRISTALEFHGDSLRYWSTLVQHAESTVPAERERLFKQLVRYKTKAQPAVLDDVQAAYFSEWHHPVIREMTALPGFDGSPEWIRDALAFPLRLDAVKRSLELLERLGVVRLVEGKYLREGVVATPREVDAIALIRYHQAMIAMGAEAMTRVDEDERDIQAVTVCLPVSLVPVLKAKIEEWTKDVLELERQADASEPSEVFQVNIQMFPFTKSGGAK